MSPLRVLQVIPSLSPRDGGPAKAICTIERALSQEGVAVTTLTTDHDLELQGGLCVGAGPHRIYVPLWLNSYKLAPALVSRLIGLVRRHDVVHIHALFSFAPTAAAWVARRMGVPYVVRPLGVLSSYGLQTRRRPLKRLSVALVEGPNLQRAAAVHFTSPAERDEAETLGVPMRSVVIPLGVEAQHSAHAAPLEHEALAGRRVILFLSRLDPKKNLEALVDAMASSQVLRGSCALLIAGTGAPAYVASLHQRVAAAGLSSQTVWLGHVEGAQKAAAFARADAFVLPSFSENFGFAPIEAAIAGMPCVLARGVAVAEGIAQAGGGMVVEPDTAAIARALELLLADESARAGMGARAAEFARREYSPQTMAQRLLGLYEGIRAPRVHDDRQH